MPAGEKNAVGPLYTRITRLRRASLPVRAIIRVGGQAAFDARRPI
jgi:hypothetical protein